MAFILHRLVYCSRNTMTGDPGAIERQIQQILVSSRRHNRLSGATGALLFTHGCFVQALEAEMPALEGIFERIQCDECHRDVTVLSLEPIAARAFPDWDMAYLGHIEAGTPATLAAMSLDDAFQRKMTGGETVLSLMRDVVKREWAWAGT